MKVITGEGAFKHNWVVPDIVAVGKGNTLTRAEPVKVWVQFATPSIDTLTKSYVVSVVRIEVTSAAEPAASKVMVRPTPVLLIR